MENSSPRRRIIVLLLATSLGFGCASMWDSIRESERTTAVEAARTYSGRGDCPKTLASLNRAEARLDIGAFGKEATNLRMRCYSKLGRTAAARAHERLLDDFYDGKNPAFPKDDGSSVFRVREIPKVEFEKPPRALKVIAPYYSEHARRSYITGRVVVTFQLSKKETPYAIRVLEMPHPLLATWAIEAIEQMERDPRRKDEVILPGGHYLATFNFEYHWAEEGLAEPEIDPYYQ